MIHSLLKFFQKNAEQKLALKISLAAFVLFYTIILLIIMTSYLYQRNMSYRDFAREANMI
jgi:hypothetical protein